METAIVFITMFAMVAVILYFFYSTRHRERLALIEKGADASLFNTGKAARERGKSSLGLLALKTGMFFMGIAVGVIMGGVLTEMAVLNEAVNYTSMIFLFGGLSLVLSYFVKARNNG
ncbi:MAG: hypothetical protein RBS37_06945 [Bacteroidales bacterium]|jgi:predicted MFS family arabinose efflux permease|nr:hypothetical protein [Bacteroidales bacterium]